MGNAGVRGDDLGDDSSDAKDKYASKKFQVLFEQNVACNVT